MMSANAASLAAMPASRISRFRAETDHVLIWASLLLLAFGLVMVYSASFAYAENASLASTHYLLRHVIFLGVGLICAFSAFQISMEDWQKMAPWLFVVGLVLLFIVLFPVIGKSINGARRWIDIGIIRPQPSELMKLCCVLYVADFAVRKREFMEDFRRAFLPILAIMAIVGILLWLEPDVGAFLMILIIVMGILFMGGLNIWIFLRLAFCLVLVLPPLAYFSNYVYDRVMAWLSPLNFLNSTGYQPFHAQLAFGRGGWSGSGLGSSVEKHLYLPEAHTDYLFAVIGEETGFLGLIVVVTLFIFIVRRAFAIGHLCVDLDRVYPALVAMGIGLWLGLQAFINMGVNVNLLPATGMTLPFMSYGGSGLVINCTALGILLRVDWENRRLMQRGRR
ncbi:MAG: putative lipid II flippase FtsW [Zoogloeaceae bacterium]|jgi:cell division protein FtsW|nr:putative lipid II flippase FtsW [Zoogloeaceae bacterium]